MPTVNIPIAVNADDVVVASNYDAPPSTYPPPGGGYAVVDNSEVQVARGYDSAVPWYWVYVGLLRFHTGLSIPDDATITAATLRVFVYNVFSADSLSLIAEWYPWTSAALSDWTYQPSNNAHSGTAISALATTQNYNLTLSNVSNVSTTGYSGIRLGLSGVGGNFATAPTGDNHVNIRDIENDATNRAQLTVQYYEPGDGPGNAYIAVGP